MFDMLTADQLWHLNTTLYGQATRVHHRMVGTNGCPLISVFSDDWAILSAWHAEIAEMQAETCAEMHRRLGQEAPADA